MIAWISVRKQVGRLHAVLHELVPSLVVCNPVGRNKVCSSALRVAVTLRNVANFLRSACAFFLVMTCGGLGSYLRAVSSSAEMDSLAGSNRFGVELFAILEQCAHGARGYGNAAQIQGLTSA